MNKTITEKVQLKNYKRAREEFRRSLYHGGSYNKAELETSRELLNSFDLEIATEERPNLKCDILIIDNNLDNNSIQNAKEDAKQQIVHLLKDIQTISQKFPSLNFYLCHKFEDFFSVEKENLGKKFTVSCFDDKNCKWGTETSKGLDEFDLILQDLFLGGKLFGTDFLSLYINNYPHIPVFIYSGSKDFDIIRETIQKGADYYIPKDETLTIPYRILQFQKDIGEILQYIDDEILQKNIIGNIRTWKLKPDYLWFGDKCYHMINHSYIHTSNDWKNLNKILYPLLSKDQSLLRINNEDWIYPLAMATWLHDIGHKGSERFGASYSIRDNHGYISAEYILKYPELFRIIEEDKSEQKDSYYKKIRFSTGNPGSAIEILYRRVKDRKKLSNIEKIALISAYHKSNTPLTNEDYYELSSDENKFIPLDFFENGERGAEQIITLEKILNKIYEKGDVRKTIGIIALFRLVDSIDINLSRIGDGSEKSLKMKVINNDLEYELLSIKRSVDIITKLYCKSPAEKALFYQRFYEDLKKDILEGEVINFKSLEDIYPDKAEFENYLLHAYYASFLSIQRTHFDLHSSIEEFKIEYLGNKKFEFTMKTPKNAEDLNTLVKERGRKDTSVYERLIGKDCYFLKELNSGKKYLQELIKSVEILLINKQIDKKEEQLGRKTWP